LCDIIAGDTSLRLAGEASDGEEAGRLIQELKPMVAVLDIHMPKRSGIDLCRFLSQQHLPLELIILTMDDEEALVNEALNLGIKGYLLKESAVTEIDPSHSSCCWWRLLHQPSLIGSTGEAQRQQ